MADRILPDSLLPKMKGRHLTQFVSGGASTQTYEFHDPPASHVRSCNAGAVIGSGGLPTFRAAQARGQARA